MHVTFHWATTPINTGTERRIQGFIVNFPWGQDSNTFLDITGLIGHPEADPGYIIKIPQGHDSSTFLTVITGHKSGSRDL